jgi:hypothetical protein
MYTWGYIKNATLAKLDLEESEANTMNLLNRFIYYANECIVQISSTVKPKHAFYEVNVDDTNVDTLIKMPTDFIAFGDDINYIIRHDDLINKNVRRIATDEDFEYVGTNQIVFHTVGRYLISYDALWIFLSNQSDNDVLEIPVDIIVCIPSYIASQCMKVDNEERATIMRNEFEVMLARVNDTNYKNTKSFRIEGDW